MKTSKKPKALILVGVSLGVFICLFFGLRRGPSPGEPVVAGRQAKEIRDPILKPSEPATEKPTFLPAATVSGPAGPRSLTMAAQEHAQLMRAARFRTFEANFAPFFDELGWSQSQRDKFLAIQVGRMESGDEMMRQLILKGAEPGKELARIVFEQTEAEMEQEFAAEFGQNIVEDIRFFGATKPARTMVNEFANSLMYGPNALTSTQAKELMLSIADNALGSDGTIAINSQNLRSIVAGAESTLSNEQRNTLIRFLENKMAVRPFVLKRSGEE